MWTRFNLNLVNVYQIPDKVDEALGMEYLPLPFEDMLDGNPSEKRAELLKAEVDAFAEKLNVVAALEAKVAALEAEVVA